MHLYPGLCVQFVLLLTYSSCLLPLPPPSESTTPPPTSDLLLQAEDDGHGLVQHQQLGLGLLALQVQLTHVAQLLERLVDVPHAQALASVVGHPPLALALGLLLRAQVLVLVDAATAFLIHFVNNIQWK